VTITLEAELESLVPITFVAVTVNVYEVASASPETEHDVVVEVQL
jgi:hypothetical protein